MILYYALTVYHQLECLLHKILIEPDKPAHLYLSNSIFIEDEHIQRLKDSGLFEEVTIMYDSDCWGIGSKVKFNSEHLLEPVLEEITELCYQSLLLPIEEYEELYICADHFPFGFALAYNKIPYHYFEEATGAHSRRNILKEELRWKNEFWFLMFEKYGIRGEAESIISKNIDFDFQLPDFYDEKAKDFSVRKLLKQLTKKQMNKILDIFGVFNTNDISNNKNLALVLTQHYSAASITTYEGQRLLYALLIDYFCENMHCIIKPHPTDRQGIYKEWYGNISLLNRDLPSELLPFCFNKKLQLTIAATSSSAYNLIDISNKVTTFESKDNRFDKLFYSMHKYFVATEIIKNQNNNHTIYSIGADTKQIENFLNQNNNNKYNIIELDEIKINTLSENKIIIVDDIYLLDEIKNYNEILNNLMKNLNDSDFIIFIDSKLDEIFYNVDNNEWAEYLIPISIYKKPLNNNSLEKEGKEWIFMYSKNSKKNYEFLNTKIEKSLKNVGITINVGQNENSIREQLLEGILYATEKKCIKLNEDLKAFKKQS